MSRRLSLLTLAVLTLLVAPASAQAATCADYPNQAAAQRAADTRDADGDGIYCEALPCPCARPGASRGGEERAEAPRRTRPARPRAQRFQAQIIDVTDGDTIRIRSDETRRRTYTVRLIGIDTPETRKPGTPVECGGKEATSNLLRAAFSAPVDTDGDGLLDREGGAGDRVTVTTDPTQDSFDRYRRLLAYVTTADRQNLAVEQLRAGWAALYVYRHPFRQLKRFRAAENQASAADWGVWGACRGDFHRVARATASARTLLIKATTGRGGAHAWRLSPQSQPDARRGDSSVRRLLGSP